MVRLKLGKIGYNNSNYGKDVFLMKKLKQKALAAQGFVVASLVGSPVFANGGDPFESLGNGAEQATENTTNLALIVAVLFLVFGGLGLMATRATREWAKGHIGWVLVGVAVIVLAAGLVDYVANMF